MVDTSVMEPGSAPPGRKKYDYDHLIRAFLTDLILKNKIQFDDTLVIVQKAEM